MGTLQGPIICRIAHLKQLRLHSLVVNDSFTKALLCGNELRGLKKRHRFGIEVGLIIQYSQQGTCRKVRCSFGTPSNDSMASNFKNEGEYINTSVVEAVEIKSGADGFLITMSDGKHLRCVHNNPQGGYPPDYAPHPAIVLRMEDGSNLLLPIIVLEMPSMLLMAAVRNVQMARPSLYQAMKEMIEQMGYAVKLVRVTKRVHEAYFAQLYLTKVGDETKKFSFDFRPSDAINIAVRCKVPIQVNKYLAYNDGMRIVEPPKHAGQAQFSDGLLAAELDRPNDEPCVETKEFDLVRNMLTAAVEERYKDAAQWRDMLTKLRSKMQNWT